MKQFCITGLFFFLPYCLLAQSIPLDRQVQNRLNVMVQGSDSVVFTGFRALDWLELDQTGLVKSSIEDSIFGLSAPGLPFRDRILRSNWLQWGNKHFLLTADPYLNAVAGKSDRKSGYLLDGAAGASIRGIFWNQLSLSVDAYGATTEFPAYVDAYILQHENAVPGEHRAIRDRNGRYPYAHVDAALTWVPDEHIALGAGYGKLFVGDGYRSLLLSDNAASYPYVRLKASYWKLTYNVIYSRYENDRLVDGRRQPKFSVIHYLGVNVGKRLQFGFFENTVWLGRDTNYQRGFDVQYLNPLILMRPVEFSLGSTDNALMGFTGKYAFRNSYIYGQFGLDDINLGQTFEHRSQHLNNKYFFQIGIWNHDLFGLKNLDWRVEWNGVRPYAFGHRKPDQNYTHNHQPLTDPFGANFHEFISLFDYSRGRWYGNLENLLALRGENPGLPYNNGEDLWGGEADVPELGSKTLQGTVHHYWYHKLSVGYLLNPQNRLSLQADVVLRQDNAPGAHRSELGVFFGLRTSLFNHYTDM